MGTISIVLEGLFALCSLGFWPKSKSLFVHDPKALHHIFVRDQDVFEETEGFFLYV